MPNAVPANGSPATPAWMLPGVNLFASGVYRGQPWPPDRVRGIAANIRKNKGLLIPPSVLGHEEDQDWLERTDLPAAGWVDPDSVHVIPDPDNPGEVILRGNVVNMPGPVASLIKSGQYSNGSGEFYELLDDFGRPQGFTMRRFGLLGGEVPQVKRLGRLPMPVPMTELKVFAESAIALRPCSRAQSFRFAERTIMDRAAAMTAIKAAMPGLSQATLDSLTDDQLKDMLANLPSPPTAAPAPASPPAPMADAPPTRDDMVAALVGAGQDQAMVSGMSDADLKNAYDALMAAQMADDDPAGVPTSPPPAASPPPPPPPVTPMSEERRRIEVEVAASKKVRAELHRFNERAKRELKAARVEPVCQDLVRKGLTPAFVNEWIKPALLGYDNTLAIHTFSEGGVTKKGTCFEAKLAAAKAIDPRKCVVVFGEKLPGGGTSPQDAKSQAVEKARNFAAINATALKAGGYATPEKFVEKFSELYDKSGADQALRILPTEFRS